MDCYHECIDVQLQLAPRESLRARCIYILGLSQQRARVEQGLGKSLMIFTFVYITCLPLAYACLRNFSHVNSSQRVDYVLAHTDLASHVEKSFIRSEMLGSDHCPLGVVINTDLFGNKQ